MRSRFQNGCIAKAGDWMVVRFRLDTPNGDRKLVAEKVCPASGSGLLTNAEQRRRAAEIIAAAGVNSTAQLRETTTSVTFATQAERFLEHSRTRRRKPVSPATYDSWRSCLDKWLLPNLGEMLLADINNGTLKELVNRLVDAGLSAKSVNTYSGLVKLVVASAIDKNGEQLYPRKWNHDFVEMPIVKNQRRPTFTSEQVTAMARKTVGKARMLMVLAASTGLRLGEILGLSIADVSDDRTTLTICQQAYRCRLSDRLKTTNAHRVVDVHPDVAAMLNQFIGGRKSGLVFATRRGKPLSQSNLLHRCLYPLQAELKIAKCGFHAFRRFRGTWLRKQRTQESLIKAWLGHSTGNTITDLYDRTATDVEHCKNVAGQVGIGFEMPSIVLSVLKNSDTETREVAVAA
jgi:integrase